MVAVFALIVLSSIYWIYSSSTSELAPEEDQGVILGLTTASPTATLKQRQFYSKQINDILAPKPESSLVFQIDAPGQSILGWVLKPWDQRTRSTKVLQPIVQNEFNQVAGVRAVAFQTSPLPGSSGLPIQFVINTTNDFSQLNDVSKDFIAKALKTGKFIFLDNDLSSTSRNRASSSIVKRHRNLASAWLM